ncbi:wobble nucleotide-excising tRNase [Enterococcus sp. PF1-24]|uniref:AAA family ATPase n=1 Tax=unclassified Enterococcus TaxID=2608891 RepID=UPI00247405FC|nr:MULTISPECIES: AAA family ATPase [unclassified Enterococcus]MDH6363071.1 wobble nucleotide-excising tRNase [Enterococcus sp. PFB1-1]MDH6400165.1 wobble nucleotide-excising tRNase [Enterococcus sp. PF1-24]
MIEKIKIHDIATYTNPVEITPRKLNFFYGSNGSGKTTISKLLASKSLPDTCEVKVSHNDDVRTLVYNRQFVEDNFKQSENLKGIFTLGQDSIEQQEQLKSLQKENSDKQTLIDTKTETIKGFDGDIETKRDELAEKSWTIQQAIGGSFSKALVGYRNSKQKFSAECLSVYEKWDKITVVELEELKAKYNIAYSQNSTIHSLFSTIDVARSLTYEISDLLTKVITGSTDSPIGQLIDLLNSSDWVRQGLGYMNNDEKKCPFCQQEISNELKQEIENYFDEAYEIDCQILNDFITKYSNYYSQVLVRIKEIIESDISIIDVSDLEVKYQLLENLIALNLEELGKKKKSPSNKISIDTAKDLLVEINDIINLFNDAIKSNNEIVRNREQEKKKCINLLWEYIVSELKVDIESYLTFVRGKENAKTSISGQIRTLKQGIRDNKSQIEAIEDSLTSVAPTVTDINNLLEKFDFKGFSLKENPQLKGTYEIVRDDGTNAKNTLSEGEYNFITFLYFYHLVYGSQEKTGITAEKVIVIDDPISSLDSNVLFIVSTLVKNLLNDCRKGQNGILQTFILTHNVYFHKEVTFLGSRDSYSPNAVLFGIIRKTDNTSSFIECPDNPIESTYQLLWKELSEDNLSTVTSFNTMRRILEYYFKIIGDVDYEKCVDEFDGQDKLVCKSLVSCINDGSHFISDDFVITFDYENIDNYKEIFKLIFKKLGHEPHYKMMMKISD